MRIHKFEVQTLQLLQHKLKLRDKRTQFKFTLRTEKEEKKFVKQQFLQST